jgi:hypothetical protein
MLLFSDKGGYEEAFDLPALEEPSTKCVDYIVPIPALIDRSSAIRCSAPVTSGPFPLTLPTTKLTTQVHYDPQTGKARRYFHIMPLGPQIQARWKDPASAKAHATPRLGNGEGLGALLQARLRWPVRCVQWRLRG